MLAIVGVGFAIAGIQAAHTFNDPNASLKDKLLAGGFVVLAVVPGVGEVEGAADLLVVGEDAEVILDTNAVIEFSRARALLNPGEVPVMTRTTLAELRDLVARGQIKMPRSAGQLRIIDDVMNINTRIDIRAPLRDRGIVRGLFGDGSIGATALESGRPIITFDKALKQVLTSLGATVR